MGNSRTLRPLSLALLSLCLMPGLGGCGFLQDWFGARHGYVFQGIDALCYPGEEIQLSARLQKGSFLSDRPGRVMIFSLNGKTLGTATTDHEGFARLPWTAPEDPGDYRVEARPEDPALSKKIGVAGILVCARTRDESFLITDLDKTVVASGFREVLEGDPLPMDQAARVLHRVQREKGYTIVYLTMRPEFLGKKSQQWLDRHNFPRGPLVLADTEQLIDNYKQYKAQKMSELRQKFPKLKIGIGDKRLDVKAYLENGVETGILIVHPKNKASQRRELIDKLSVVEPQVQVVFNWQQIERIIFDGARYSPGGMIQRLRDWPADQQPAHQ